MTPQCSITRLANGRINVRLQGHFTHPHWLAFLFAALSSQRISVVSGTARRGSDQAWDARLELDFAASAAQPERLDYLTLAQQPAPLVTESPRLRHFQITRRLDGSLDVRVQGPDQLGFLHRMLSKLSLLTLFPAELEIATTSGLIQDRLLLGGIGGIAPNPTVEKSLETMLRGFLTAE